MVSNLDSVRIVLCVISTFITCARHSLLQVFVLSTMNYVMFLLSNKITCALKLEWLHKQRIAPLSCNALCVSITFLYTHMCVCKAGGSSRAARGMALPHFGLSNHVTINEW